MRDELGMLYQDEQFAHLFPKDGQPALCPWRLALVTVMQFAEGLSDRQAADAVRARLDWKYALGLELEDSGFDFSVLSEFRARLISGNAEQVLFETMFNHFKQKGLVKAGGRQRTDATHVLAAVRATNRVVCVGETMHATLNVLAEVAPEWLCSFAPDEWHERYDHRVEQYRLPKEKAKRTALVEAIGKDGYELLTAIYETPHLNWLHHIRAVQILRAVWLQQTEHLTDTNYAEAKQFVQSRQQYGIDLIAPTRSDHKWQAKEKQGFDASNFPIDWDRQVATCPMGHESSSWTPAVDRYDNEVIKIKFSMKECKKCEMKVHCTKAERRTITVRIKEHHQTLQEIRARQKHAAFWEKYRTRSGIEGTISQGVRAFGMRRSRYRGREKTHLQHIWILSQNALENLAYLTRKAW